jgi:hypothetical protein
MAGEHIDIPHRSSASVSVMVSGGRETSSVGASQIADTDFAEALKKSISESRVFAALLNQDEADFLLEAYIGVLQQPMMGFNMTVSLEVSYRLIRLSTGEVLLEQPIRSTYTAEMGDAFVAVTRLRLATEGAARVNIDRVIKEISQLRL